MKAMELIQWGIAHFGELSVAFMAMLGALVGFLSAALAVSLIIPGEHPDKELQWAVDLVKKISRK